MGRRKKPEASKTFETLIKDTIEATTPVKAKREPKKDPKNTGGYKSVQTMNTIGHGKTPGAIEKTGRRLRENVLEAFERLGGVDWLVKLGKDDPKLFVPFLLKITPQEKASSDTNSEHGGVQVNISFESPTSTFKEATIIPANFEDTTDDSEGDIEDES